MVLTAMTVAVTRARMNRAEAGGYEDSIVQVATPAVAKMAVTESGELRERRRQNWELQGFAGRGECETII